MWFNIFHNKTGNNISQGITSAYTYGRTSGIKKRKSFIRQIFTDTLLCVYKVVKINIFFRPVEAMFENLVKACLYTEIICSVLENTQIT